MKNLRVLPLAALAAVSFSTAAAETSIQDNPRVRITTTLGVIEIELYPERSPQTVANFLNYVETGFYNGTIFHRVIPGFMI